jgi:hypothetical protein
LNPTIYTVVSVGDKSAPRWEIHAHAGGQGTPTGYSADTEGGAIRLAVLLQAAAGAA